MCLLTSSLTPFGPPFYPPFTSFTSFTLVPPFVVGSEGGAPPSHGSEGGAPLGGATPVMGVKVALSPLNCHISLETEPP
jgi:hypothetical protein